METFHIAQHIPMNNKKWETRRCLIPHPYLFSFIYASPLPVLKGAMVRGPSGISILPNSCSYL